MEPPSIEPGFYINWGTLLLITVILFFAFVFSGASAAVLSLTSQSISDLKKANKSGVSFIIKTLKRKPNLLMNAIVIGNSFMQIAFIVVVYKMLTTLFVYYNMFVAILVLTITISPFLILFGVLIPKRIASDYSSAFILKFSGILKFAYYLFLPLSIIFLKLIRIFKPKSAKTNSELSIDILTDVIDHSPNQSAENKLMLKAIVNSIDTEVSDIFRPRVDIVAIDIDINFAQLTELVSNTIYSRIPVYRNNLDTIVGVLYIKDLLPYIRIEGESFYWQKLIRKHYVVPESKLINDLLDDFQKNKVHMAIVVDEYGGTSGIITLEDILEEVVGEILDETDNEAEFPTFCANADGSFTFESKTPLNDFYRILEKNNIDFDEQDEEAKTIGGLLIEIKGDFLDKGEIIRIDNLLFEVTKIEGNRVLEVNVRLNNDE